jgi:hypothetical protein
MTKFKYFVAAAALCSAFATPGIAQQAVQEPGLQAFYGSLGVNSTKGGLNTVAASRNEILQANGSVKRDSAALKR